MSQTESPSADLVGPGGRKPLQAGTFGMLLFLAALSVLFGSTIVGYLYLRSMHPTWPPEGSPAAPVGSLWLSTLLIVLASVGIECARRSVRRDRQAALRISLVVTLLLAGMFLANQIHNWSTVSAVLVPPGSKGLVFLAVFYVLTGTHALHVVGGIVHLLVVIRRAFGGGYTSKSYAGIRYGAMYWHFLDAVWVTMFVLLFLV